MRLELSNISLPFGVLKNGLTLNFTAPVTGLTGPSGVGKTSVLELIAGLRKPATGSISLDGKMLTDVESKVFIQPWERKIGFVPQDQALFPHLTVEGNIFYSQPSIRPASLSEEKQNLLDLLELSPLLKRNVGMLSGGEKGRVALARALRSGPQLLLLDEPLAHLDDRLRQRALEHFRMLRESLGIPIIFVSHSTAEINSICDEVIVLE